MSTSFSHSATLSGSPQVLWSAYSSEDYWRARVTAVGTDRDRVEEFHHGDDGVRVVVTHVIPDEEIPEAAAKVLRGGLTIRRTTSYEPFDGERIVGGARAEAAGGRALVDGTGRAVATGADTTEESVSGTVTVSIPLLGGRLEKMVVSYLDTLFAAEYAHLERWITAG